MPKCGTTTVATLVDTHPAICLHSQKEPGDLLHRPVPAGTSGYRIHANTRYLADFSTSYGLTNNRQRFAEGVAALGLAPDELRYVICLRRPADLVKSYLRHIVERRRVDLVADRQNIVAELKSACDFPGALDFLCQMAGPSAAFVITFDSIADTEKQAQLLTQIADWLDLPIPEKIEARWANASGSVGRYPASIEKLAGILRRSNFVRNMSPTSRARLRTLFAASDKTSPRDSAAEKVIIAEVLASQTIKASQELFDTIKSGPLISVWDQHER